MCVYVSVFLEILSQNQRYNIYSHDLTTFTILDGCILWEYYITICN